MSKPNQVSLAVLVLIAVGSIIGAAQTAQFETPKYEVGAQFSSLTLADFGNRTLPGFGARFTYNLNNSFALEAEGNLFPRDDRSSTFRNGGRAVEGLFGVKAGKRWNRFGLFAKGRPGLIRFTRAEPEFTATAAELASGNLGPNAFHTRALTHFALDMGGVFELYASRHWMTRIDAGTTMIRYGAISALAISGPIGGGGPLTVTTFQVPGNTTFNFQFSAGIGYRF
jgi:hypothetical protein